MMDLVPDMKTFEKGTVNHVFVYGTLKRGFRLNHALTSHATFVGTAHIKGYMFHKGGFPAVVLEPEGMTVLGEVWSIDEGKYADLITQLDMIEGVPHHYFRIPIKVSTGHICWIYVQPASEIKQDWGVITDGQWLYAKQTPVKWSEFIASPENHLLAFPTKPKLIYETASQCMVVNQNLTQGYGLPLPMILSSAYRARIEEKPPKSKLVELAWMDAKGAPKEKFDDKKPIETI